MEMLLTADERILDLGRSSRTFSPAQRRALLAVWGGCACCGAAPERCDIHHVDPVGTRRAHRHRQRSAQMPALPPRPPPQDSGETDSNPTGPTSSPFPTDTERRHRARQPRHPAALGAGRHHRPSRPHPPLRAWAEQPLDPVGRTRRHRPHPRTHQGPHHQRRRTPPHRAAPRPAPPPTRRARTSRLTDAREPLRVSGSPGPEEAEAVVEGSTPWVPPPAPPPPTPR